MNRVESFQAAIEWNVLRRRCELDTVRRPRHIICC